MRRRKFKCGVKSKKLFYCILFVLVFYIKKIIRTVFFYIPHGTVFYDTNVVIIMHTFVYYVSYEVFYDIYILEKYLCYHICINIISYTNVHVQSFSLVYNYTFHMTSSYCCHSSVSYYYHFHHLLL